MGNKLKVFFVLSVLNIVQIHAQDKSNFFTLDNIFSPRSEIVEDEYGYILITSRDGLYKYNGIDFYFTPYEKAFGSIDPHDRDFLVKADNNKNLWFSSFKGELSFKDSIGNYHNLKEDISLYKTQDFVTSFVANEKSMFISTNNGAFYNYSNERNSLDSLFSVPRINNEYQIISSFGILRNDYILVATESGNLYTYEISKGNLKELPLIDIEFKQHLGVVTDKDDNFWIATEVNGVFKYNPYTQDKPLQLNLDDSQYSIEDSSFPLFTFIYCDSKNRIWMGSDGDGLYRVSGDELEVYRRESRTKFSISNNTILNIYEDSNNNMWFVSKMGEINISPNVKQNIKYYSGNEKDIPTRILTIFKSKDSSLWIGTDGYGLNHTLANGNSFQYSPNSKGEFYFEGSYIQGVKEDSEGNLWIATYKSGLWKLDRQSNKFEKLTIVDDAGVSSDDIRTLFIDSKNRIWASSGVAIHVFDEKGSTLGTFSYTESGLKGFVASSIVESKDGKIWLGILGGGLFEFSENSDNFEDSFFINKQYFKKSDDDVRDYSISFISCGQTNDLWLVTKGMFLIKYDSKEYSFESFADNSTLKSINAQAILVDENSDLWISSTKGIHHYDSETKELRSHYDFDGLQGNSFVSRSAYKDEEGQLYFGGDNGLSSFSSNEMEKVFSTPVLYINSIDILNKPGSDIIPEQLKSDVELVKSIELEASQSSFSFEFSAINNVLNSNYYYTYKLEGFDRYWIKPKRENIASYTNIPSGKYTFKVRAGSKQGVWDIGSKEIKINIKPLWWKSNLAYVIYMLLLAILIYLSMLWTRMKNSLEREAWKNRKEKELHATKMLFFAKMSHEIQTPLTLILGPIDEMLERAGGSKNQLLFERLTMINNNASRLSRIANELMTVRDHELGISKLRVKRNNIVNDLKLISLSFQQQARFKKIDFIQEFSDDEIILWYDRDKLEHVFYNLLSNAFKFTPSEGDVLLKVNHNKEKELLEIFIHDSGPGIPKKELDKIFKLFYQSKDGKKVKGSGIGLALTREMLRLHHGNVEVKSSEGEGTVFRVELSTAEDTFTDDDKLIEELELDQDEKGNYNDLPEKLESIKFEKKHTILIVEDNVEMQIFLKDVLEEQYNVLVADNGNKGISLAEKKFPDLIVSDIMMPEMDGLEMSEYLKSRKSTAHIPIILITAKNSTKTKIEGLQSGVLEVIRKPFNSNELHLKIKNLIDQKEQIISKFKTDLISKPTEIEEKSKDEIFIEKLVDELNKNLEKSDFKLEELASTMNMSYSVIYRKCNEITGKTLVEFVRQLKLKKAAQLILGQGYNVSEASFMVGYKDSKYFTKCFKEEFNLTPIAMKKESAEKGVEVTLSKYEISDFGTSN